MSRFAEKAVRIDVGMAKIKILAALARTARHLQTIPVFGPLAALAVEAFAHRWRVSAVALLYDIRGAIVLPAKRTTVQVAPERDSDVEHARNS